MPTTPRSTKATTARKRSTTLRRPVARKAGWTDLDVRAVDTARLLAADAVQKVGNGHPGTAMSLAPAAYLLYQNVMTHDPGDAAWLGRDRFVLSAGHSSLTQYIQLFLSGYGLELDDLKALRTWGSRTPAHPEVHHTTGIEITTGPLGSGLASAVGMAMAQRRQRGLLDPDAKAGESPFDHHIWVIASDGDLMEGVSAEASSLAGHQQLGNLTVIYDANQISIEDQTDISFSEDVAARYRAYGWDVVDVDWRGDGDGAAYVEDVDALLAALDKSKKSNRPTLVQLHTIIAWPAPTKQDTGKSHGSALGDAEIAATKELLGFNPAKTFEVDRAVLSHTRQVGKRGKAAHKAWDKTYAAWRKANPDRAAPARPPRRRRPAGRARRRPAGVRGRHDKGVATRAASGKVLTALAGVMPELWGGSADLAESNNTTMEGEPSFIPAQPADPRVEGRPVRPHPALRHPRARDGHDPQRDRARGPDPALRRHLLGLLRLHASRGAARGHPAAAGHLRLDPRLHRPRRGRPDPPAGRAPRLAARHPGPGRRPAGRRQRDRGRLVGHPATPSPGGAGPHPPEPAGLRRAKVVASASDAAKGAYVLVDVDQDARRPPTSSSSPPAPRCALAVEARGIPGEQGVGTRVVSMPCREWFEEQDQAYRDSVLPPQVRARVSVEAAVLASAGATSSATPDASSAWSTSAPRPTTRRCTASSGSPRPPSWRRPSRPPGRTARRGRFRSSARRRRTRDRSTTRSAATKHCIQREATEHD